MSADVAPDELDEGGDIPADNADAAYADDFFSACEAVKVVVERTRERWRAAGVLIDAPTEPVPRRAVDHMDGFLEVLQRRQAEHAEHAATCSAPLCDECGRYSCSTCRLVRVPTIDAACWDCSLAQEIPTIQIPERYSDAGFGPAALERLRLRVRSQKALELTCDVVRRTPIPNCVVSGAAGTGKSTLASAGVQQIVADSLHPNKKARDAHAWPVPRLIRARWVSAIAIGLARQRHRLGSEDEAELITEATEADLLVLDDLGAEGARDQDAIAQVIHARHDAGTPTWVTTGLSSAELAARYGGGLQRRIVEGAVIIRCGGVE